MIGPHQNLHGSRDFTTHLSGWFVIHGLRHAIFNLYKLRIIEELLIIKVRKMRAIKYYWLAGAYIYILKSYTKQNETNSKVQVMLLL